MCSASSSITRNIHIHAANFICNIVKATFFLWFCFVLFPFQQQKNERVNSFWIVYFRTKATNQVFCQRKVQLRTICYKTMLTLPLAINIFFSSLLVFAGFILYFWHLPVWLLRIFSSQKQNWICLRERNKKNNSGQFYLWLQIDAVDLYPNHLESNTHNSV